MTRARRRSRNDTGATLRRGERFWPDSIYKDLLVSLAIFILLVLLATFVGVATGPKADPSDTSYLPRPEWYFLFLFKFLAIYGQIPLLGKIEWLATVVVPGIAVLLLTLLPFIDRSPRRYYGKRILPITIMAIIVVGIVLLTLMADVPTVSPNGSTFIGLLQAIVGLVVPGLGIILLFVLSFLFKNTPVRTMVWTTGLTAVLMLAFTGAVLAMAPRTTTEETAVATTLTDQIIAGQDLYSINCTECHGDDGKVTTITGVEGLEGKEISPINGHDVLYTLDDASLAEVIVYGRPDAGHDAVREVLQSGRIIQDRDRRNRHVHALHVGRPVRGAARPAALPGAGSGRSPLVRRPHPAHREALLPVVPPRGQGEQQFPDGLV